MKLTKLRLALGLLACGLLWGCASPGPPLPPSLELAEPVNDLRAVRKGDKVYLTWSVPVKTTEKRNIRHPGVTKVCRSLAPASNECNPPLATIPASVLPSARQATTTMEARYIDQLSSGFERDHPTAILRYAVSVLNSYGRTAGLSNEVSVPSAPTLAPPSDFNAQLERDGAKLAWHPVIPPPIPGLHFIYRVYRREDKAGADEIVGDLPVAGQPLPAILDRNFEWEKAYQYLVTVVTVASTNGGADQEVEGEDSEPKALLMHDIFPPATPVGLQAVFSASAAKPFIDLVWTPDTDRDVAGYNVYRREQDKPAVKLNGKLLTAAAYRDSEIALGERYFYSVSAVDLRGNESSRSEEASETTPAP